MKEQISLNGWWDWRVPGGNTLQMQVPACYECVGEALYSRSIDLPDISGKRVVLHFEGVHYCGRVTVNGRSVGEMLPFVFYDFDITGDVRSGCNQLEVAITDITARFGSTRGWEDYGGISRDVWVEIADLVGLQDTQWLTRMKDGYTAADATLNVELYNLTGAPAKAAVTAALFFKGDLVAQTTAEVAIAETLAWSPLRFALDRVYPWSPGEPNLYELAIDVTCGGMSDSRRMGVGFREFVTEGSHFLLNGVRTFLKGVARHDMWGGQGFTLSRKQIEEDLTLIKKMGANFIRLVHYPHSRYTLEYAAKIGLMVSEEPGLWWSDLGDEQIIADALEIIRRTILRDRSNPAVIAWLFFNECVLDNATGYLLRGAELCRSLDPSRLLSGASCMSNETNKKIFDDTGMDFYTQHPYCYEGEAIQAAAEALRGKPLVITEWGGWLIHYNPNLIATNKRIIGRLAHAGDDEPALSGMCWWQWQDIIMMSRGLPGCIKGVLGDGLVDQYRVRKPTYAVMAEFFDTVDIEPEPGFDVEEYPVVPAADVLPLDLSALRDAQNDAIWREASKLDNVKRCKPSLCRVTNYEGIFIHKEIRMLSGLRCDIPVGRPVLLRAGRSSVTVPVDRRVDAVYLFGAVTFLEGYPMRGTLGNTAALLTLNYYDGLVVQTPLRHGYEIASASLIGRSSRVNAQAVYAPRVAKLTQDYDYETYAINLLQVPADAGKQLVSISMEAVDENFEPVIYGISVKPAEGVHHEEKV